jgi:casein kinase 1
MSSHTHGSATSTQNIVGVHYRVGKKIGEGSFGVIFEGQLPPLTSIPRPYLTPASLATGVNLLNSQSVAIKFVRTVSLFRPRNPFLTLTCYIWIL